MLLVTGVLRGIRTEHVGQGESAFEKRIAVLDMGKDGMIRQNVTLAGRDLEDWNPEPNTNVALEVSVRAFSKRSGDAAWELKAWRDCPEMAVGSPFETIA